MRSRSWSGATRWHPTGAGQDVSAALRVDDQVDDRRERDELALLEPPLRLTKVARGERHVTAADCHRDRDHVALATAGTGTLGLVHTGTFGAENGSGP